jgi:hypothetical protein
MPAGRSLSGQTLRHIPFRLNMVGMQREQDCGMSVGHSWQSGKQWTQGMAL